LQPKQTKEKEVAYCTQAPIHDPKITNNVYSHAMKDSTLTILHQELLSLSPEVQQKVKDAVLPKCIITGDLKDILLNQDAHKCSVLLLNGEFLKLTVGSVLHFCCLGLDCHDSYLSCSSATSKL
jgi:hypothetical protein